MGIRHKETNIGTENRLIRAEFLFGYDVRGHHKRERKQLYRRSRNAVDRKRRNNAAWF